MSHVAEKWLSEPTVIEVMFKVSPDVNPDVYGNAQAIWVRLYLLKSIGEFESADIFLLKDQDKELLANDLKRRETFQFEPAEERTKTLNLPTEETPEKKLFVGVVAGYRDWGDATWRAATTISTQQTTNLVVYVNRLQIRIEKKD